MVAARRPAGPEEAVHSPDFDEFKGSLSLYRLESGAEPDELFCYREPTSTAAMSQRTPSMTDVAMDMAEGGLARFVTCSCVIAVRLL